MSESQLTDNHIKTLQSIPESTPSPLETLVAQVEHDYEEQVLGRPPAGRLTPTEAVRLRTWWEEAVRIEMSLDASTPAEERIIRSDLFALWWFIDSGQIDKFPDSTKAARLFIARIHKLNEEEPKLKKHPNLPEIGIEIEVTDELATLQHELEIYKTALNLSPENEVDRQQLIYDMQRSNPNADISSFFSPNNSDQLLISLLRAYAILKEFSISSPLNFFNQVVARHSLLTPLSLSGIANIYPDDPNKLGQTEIATTPTSNASTIAREVVMNFFSRIGNSKLGIHHTVMGPELSPAHPEGATHFLISTAAGLTVDHTTEYAKPDAPNLSLERFPKPTHNPDGSFTYFPFHQIRTSSQLTAFRRPLTHAWETRSALQYQTKSQLGAFVRELRFAANAAWGLEESQKDEKSPLAKIYIEFIRNWHALLTRHEVLDPKQSHYQINLVDIDQIRPEILKSNPAKPEDDIDLMCAQAVIKDHALHNRIEYIKAVGQINIARARSEVSKPKRKSFNNDGEFINALKTWQASSFSYQAEQLVRDFNAQVLEYSKR